MESDRSSSWRNVRLGDIAYEIRDLYEPTPDEAIPYIGLGNIDADNLRLSSIGESSETTSTKKKFAPGDILFGSLRPYFRKVYKPDFEGVCSTDITVIRSKEDVNQGFLYYLIASPQFIEYATNVSTGTRMPRANWGVLEDSLWRIPDQHHQIKIAQILSSFDELIKNNLRRIEILEEMARLIHRDWFVHFRFPGHEEVEMVESELGSIPEGWEVKKLKDTCELVVGQSPKSESYNEEGRGLPFHQGVTDFGDRYPNHHRYCTVTKRVAKPKDILFSVRAPVGRINVADRELVVGRGLHAIRSKRGWQEYLYQQLKARFHEEDMMGGGTIFKSVTKRDMLGLDLLFPPGELVEMFESLVSPVIALAGALTKMEASLRKSRDLLIPRLISGSIKFREGDRRVPITS